MRGRAVPCRAVPLSSRPWAAAPTSYRRRKFPARRTRGEREPNARRTRKNRGGRVRPTPRTRKHDGEQDRVETGETTTGEAAAATLTATATARIETRTARLQTRVADPSLLPSPSGLPHLLLWVAFGDLDGAPPVALDSTWPLRPHAKACVQARGASSPGHPVLRAVLRACLRASMPRTMPPCHELCTLLPCSSPPSGAVGDLRRGPACPHPVPPRPGRELFPPPSQAGSVGQLFGGFLARKRICYQFATPWGSNPRELPPVDLKSTPLPTWANRHQSSKK